MRTIGFRSYAAFVLSCSLVATVAAAERPWSRVVREGPVEYRLGHVWTVALSTDVEKVVGTLDENAVPALLDAFDSDEEPLVEGALWVLCQLGDKRAKTVCTHYDTPPKPVSQPAPYYPHDAFAKRVEGTVEVRFLISSSGQVTHAIVSKSIRMLDAAALHCVRRWTFSPAQRGGKRVPSVATAPVTFSITGQH